MSSIVSTLTTVKCDAYGCEQERIDVRGNLIDEVNYNKQGWGEIYLNGNEFDLCPNHLEDIQLILFGVDDDHAENNADGIIPFDPNDEVATGAKDHG